MYHLILQRCSSVNPDNILLATIVIVGLAYKGALRPVARDKMVYCWTCTPEVWSLSDQQSHRSFIFKSMALRPFQLSSSNPTMPATQGFEHLTSPYNDEDAVFTSLGYVAESLAPSEDGPYVDVSDPIGDQLVITKYKLCDEAAARIMLALIHDCLLIIIPAFRGELPETFITLRCRLTSLYITRFDIARLQPFFQSKGLSSQYLFVDQLLDLRERTLFGDLAQRETMANGVAADERYTLHELIQEIVQHATNSPVSEWHDKLNFAYLDTLQHVNIALDTMPPPDEEEKWEVCNSIRALLDLAHWTGDSTGATDSVGKEDLTLTPEREMTFLYDIFHSLDAYARCPSPEGTTDDPDVPVILAFSAHSGKDYSSVLRKSHRSIPPSQWTARARSAMTMR